MVGAGDIVIKSFGGNGELTAAGLMPGSTCRVEWASSPTGPWTNTWGKLDAIPVSGAGRIAVNVPMFYRVVGIPSPSGMVAIPAGTNSGTDPDFGAYSLTVAAFYMDATEVTKAKWDEVYTWALTNGYTFFNAGSGKAADHPVQTVSWYDCVTWCNARSQKEGKTPCYSLSDWSCNFSANGYRLPTSEEWEYAARGGLSNKRFPWGDVIDQTRANYNGNPLSSGGYAYDTGYLGYDTRYATGGYPYTSPAGAFAANGYGLYDMAGNVWEWRNDTSDSYRYVRGGSWGTDAFRAQCGSSHWYYPASAYYDFGFRSVCR
jgi:formylglycine-generating enzyme required for sulfatase activity